eukprot:1158912-Pelagomonas_calceolata.AAC.1
MGQLRRAARGAQGHVSLGPLPERQPWRAAGSASLRAAMGGQRHGKETHVQGLKALLTEQPNGYRALLHAIRKCYLTSTLANVSPKLAYTQTNTDTHTHTPAEESCCEAASAAMPASKPKEDSGP